MREVVCAIILRDSNILLVKKRETWITPGGKPEKGESHKACLRREFAEELSGTKITNIRPYKTVKGKAPHKRDIVKVHYYFADLDGSLKEASAEIGDRAYWNRQNLPNLSELTAILIDFLKGDGYI